MIGDWQAGRARRPLIWRWCPGHPGYAAPTTFDLAFDEQPAIEHVLPNGKIPDVFCRTAIEVCYAHPIPDEKIIAYRDARLDWIELDAERILEDPSFWLVKRSSLREEFCGECLASQNKALRDATARIEQESLDAAARLREFSSDAEAAIEKRKSSASASIQRGLEDLRLRERALDKKVASLKLGDLEKARQQMQSNLDDLTNRCDERSAELAKSTREEHAARGMLIDLRFKQENVRAESDRLLQLAKDAGNDFLVARAKLDSDERYIKITEIRKLEERYETTFNNVERQRLYGIQLKREIDALEASKLRAKSA